MNVYSSNNSHLIQLKLRFMVLCYFIIYCNFGCPKQINYTFGAPQSMHKDITILPMDNCILTRFLGGNIGKYYLDYFKGFGKCKY